ncbi:hypothetical protein Csa_012358 [Cucumis sativus]|uniref:Uncharacterized protein n=1 Tax=Cucumis sativus TaxID=3659 RepID=A0A0A0L0I9_CUCSA|nr:hypothetical protein Csa_012358 [Cucumis sativus]
MHTGLKIKLLLFCRSKIQKMLKDFLRSISLMQKKQNPKNFHLPPQVGGRFFRLRSMKTPTTPLPNSIPSPKTPKKLFPPKSKKKQPQLSVIFHRQTNIKTNPLQNSNQKKQIKVESVKDL